MLAFSFHVVFQVNSVFLICRSISWTSGTVEELISCKVELGFVYLFPLSKVALNICSICSFLVYVRK